MQRFIKRVLRVLDGTPRAYGDKENKGQSIVEMALVMPLLLVLIVGLVEIGWFARNYLTLLEVTRAGARRGATLQEEFGPLQWERSDASRLLSLAPTCDVDPRFCGNCDSGATPVDPDPDDDTVPPPPVNTSGLFSADACYTPDQITELLQFRANGRTCSWATSPGGILGFYNIVLCQMLESLNPLELSVDNEIDDIIISVFSVLVINNNEILEGLPDFSGDIDLTNTFTVLENEFVEDEDGNSLRGYLPVVVGRWPTNANECNVWQDPETGQSFIWQSGRPIEMIYERDPFDYYDQTALGNGQNVSVVNLIRIDDDGNQVPDPRGYPIELAEWDPSIAPNGAWVSVGFDGYSWPELQRGFMYRGQRHVKDRETDDYIRRSFVINGTERELILRCWGSDKDVYWMQERLRGNRFIMSDSEIASLRAEFDDFCDTCDQRELLPHNGIILVEIYWRHELLLGLPVFSVFYDAADFEASTIHVWSAFSTPSVIPQIRYTFDSGEFIRP